jgi:hypothetical protein
MFIKPDPGPCPVDDAPHTTCTSPDYDGAVTIVQAPCRDGIAPVPMVGAVNVPFLVGQVKQQTLPPGQFSTAGYGQMTPRYRKKKP